MDLYTQLLKHNQLKNKNLKTLAQSQMGKEWKSFDEAMPNFDFNNIKENEQILERIGFPKSFAKDKNSMRKIMNYMR